MLPDYPRRVCSNGGTPGCLDDVQHLYNTSAFLARGECRTYIGGAEANTVAMYGQMTLHPDTQVQYFDECAPRPPSAPLVDSNVMCLDHVVPHVTGRTLLPPATSGIQANDIEFDQTAFLHGKETVHLSTLLHKTDCCTKTCSGHT